MRANAFDVVAVQPAAEIQHAKRKIAFGLSVSSATVADLCREIVQQSLYHVVVQGSHLIACRPFAEVVFERKFVQLRLIDRVEKLSDKLFVFKLEILAIDRHRHRGFVEVAAQGLSQLLELFERGSGATRNAT